MTILRILSVILLIFTTTACSSFRQNFSQTLHDMRHVEAVKPWQKNILAKDEMQLGGDAMESYFDSHTYFSKEASTGGSGVGGGGCGCN